jgi:hypothetical protein
MKMNTKKETMAAVVILSLVSLIITLPLFMSKDLIITQDILWHLVWSEQFQKTLTDGVLYPRWVDTPFGYGSPTFIFYAPLSFYVISLINIFTNSTILSIKIAIYLSFFLSGLTMYFFARKINGERAGLISGVFYQLIPYHIFDLFSRGVVPELFAFIWFPVILLFIREIYAREKASSTGLLSLAYAGLIMTHLVSSFMFTFVIIGYGLYLSLSVEKKGLLRMLCAIALGLGLSSIYLLPVIFERGFTHIELIKLLDYRDHFLFLHKTLIKTEFYPVVHGIAILETVFLVFSFLLIKKQLIKGNNIFFVVLLSVSLFLATPLSSLIWKYTPEFPNLQFPWRWLTFSGLSASIIGGNLIGNFTRDVRRSAIVVSSSLLIIALLIMLPISFFKEGEVDQWRMHPGLFSPIEYRPVWLDDPRRILVPAEKAAIVRGDGSVCILDWKSNRRVVSTIGNTPLILKFSTFYYPGWKAAIDGKINELRTEKVTGSIMLEVPVGRHEIELIFEDTPARHYGKVISVVSLFGVILLACTRFFPPEAKREAVDT